MATAVHTDLCTICERQNTTSIADRWCPECDEFLCTSCSNHHNAAKISMGHSTVDVTTGKALQEILVDIKTKCKIHDSQLEFFCPKYDSSFCVQCTSDHKQCGSFSSLREFVGSEKSSIIAELTESVTNLKSVLVKMKDNKQDNLGCFKRQYLDCKRQIQAVKVIINNKIDKIEAAMLQELDLLYKKSNDNLEKIVKQYIEYEQKLDKLLNSFNTVKSNGSNIQMFHSVQKFTKDIQELKNEIQQITKGDDNKKVELEINLKPKCLDGTVVESFGDIRLIEHACDDCLNTLTGNRPQFLIPPADVQNITLKQRLDIDLKDIVGDNLIFGCCYADNGAILIASHENSRIIVLKENCTYDREIKMHCRLNKIVFANGNIYVSSYPEKSLTSVDFSTGTIIKTVKFESTCDALALANDRIIINIVDKEYMIFDLNLEYVGAIPIRSGKNVHHVSYFNGKLYFGDQISVSCNDMTGTLKWKVQDKDLPQKVRACTVDSRGNVFAASYTKNNIIAVSPNGDKWKIATQLVNMKRSTALFCDRRRGRILVSSDISPRLQEYEIQY